MKTIILVLGLCLINAASYSQSGNAKMDAILKQMRNQNSKGTIHFETKGTSVTDNATLIKDAKGIYVLGSSMLTGKGDGSQVHLFFAKMQSGTQPISQNKDANATAIINGTGYQIKGIAMLKVSGKTIGGTFTGLIYEIPNGKSKANVVASGKISGSFKNLNIPQ
ncbi:hypothetical protein [Pedobacter foliorum]|uniref:hypothetical protein n=1 Tax=Pedobacter foliorum TaxID=2739058 RepID=UPI0015650B04|nr:hypothetical protein [Pedobacter foliorum]NRF40093.1 hypothetical protein [Pedobacter foliorum]